ncbi:cation:proton antiporter regulatory subunit [Paenibacillus aquistagni]|uniref:cation:proton antiporter regulatory subunit n=1 Tax=Paenibacillus aquistagni TaxID=1852522 RepID=UPI00145BC074|nr:cation:proton antiporter regulatory subunit [Paenibacillus aquistagni]NMM53677.1 cation:proton antiporter regulatory subunit [Paenibacillus aquistagni]
MTMIRESDLPGVGRKFQIETNTGEKLAIIIHNDGRRELYHFDQEDPDEIISGVSLDDDEARQLAAIVGGMTYKPKALETVEVSLEELVIEWCKVESHYKCKNQSIAELQVRQRTGATILAIVEKNSQKINPSPSEKLHADMTLVIAGERKQIKALKELLING